MKVLVTGGAGYIGSHTCLELLNAGHEAVIVDNLCNSKEAAVDRVAELSGKPLPLHEANIADKTNLNALFAQHNFDAVIHFAAYKAVGESVEKPLEYYSNNVAGTINLLEVMRENSVKKLVFSSSCTVYGDPDVVPITEDAPLKNATNPYGQSKLIVETILRDLHHADPTWQIIPLRYFNPVGSHESGHLGEDPNGIPTNLFPYITQVAIGRLKKLSVFGNDFPTHDGTGVRDYIHVSDLARGHLKAIEKLATNPGLVAYNLGTGIGYSVLDVIHTFEKATGQKIAYEIVGRRAGDIAETYADPSKAAHELGWKAEKTLHDMCVDGWRWQTQNPNGYA